MQRAIVILMVLGYVSSSQRPYGSYGRNPGLGVGSGGAIIFPNSRPNVRPVRPGIGIGPAHGVVRPQIFPPVGGVGGAHLQPAVGAVGVGAQQPFATAGGTCTTISPLVHASHQGSQYHFSWCADGGAKYEGGQARNYCRNLGPGWIGVSIETIPENTFVSRIIADHNLDYIWTSGEKINGGWRWGSGSPFVGLDWSHTGLDGLPQPDNREDNAENCLGILNNFYDDGIKWHDIACHHLKPIICERNALGNIGVGSHGVGVGSHGVGVGGVVNTGSSNVYG